MEIAEGLILCPIVTISVWGPNYQLPFLARYFGEKPLLRLLAERAIEFKQVTGDVSLATEPDGSAYLSPEPAYRGPANSDPEAAAYAGIQRFGTWIAEPDRRELIRRAAAQTILTESKAADAIEIALEQGEEVKQAFSIRAVGSETNRIERIRRGALQWAQSYCRSAMIYDESYALLNETDSWEFAYEAARACTAQTGIFKAGEEVLQKADVLSFAQLLRRQLLLPGDIPALRELEATRIFRDWLWGELTDGRNPASEWLKVRSVDLEVGWLRQLSIGVLAVAKAFASGFAKQKFGVESEIASGMIEIGADVVIDNAFGRVAKKVYDHNPRRFTEGLAAVVGRRAIRSSDTSHQTR
ncbi:MAG TPA: hypothetical protein VFE63_11405 [Roseiarcus sp.]|nr:hypothetical protein [Roseiarcus sp.]